MDRFGHPLLFANDSQGAFTCHHGEEEDEICFASISGNVLSINDFDDDGDLDFVAKTSSHVQFFNNDGRGFFSEGIESKLGLPIGVGLQNVGNVAVGDVNGDKTLDFVWVSDDSSRNDFGQLVGNGRYGLTLTGDNGEHNFAGWIDQFVPSGDEYSRTMNQPELIDIDYDGDLDLLVTEFESRGTSISVAWYENLDGRGAFGSRQEVYSATQESALSSVSTVFADINDDQVDELIIAANSVFAVGTDEIFGLRIEETRSTITVYENRLVGDVDGNSEVDFADFLTLAANFGRDDGVTWSFGDFDGNNSVDFTDFLLLSQNFGSRRT